LSPPINHKLLGVACVLEAEAAWRAALCSVYGFENFDSTATGSDVNSLTAFGIRFLPLNDGTQPTVQSYSQTGGVVRSGPNNLLNDRDFSLPARGPISVVPISASDYLFGLGMWNVGGGAVPEPATWAMMVGGFGLMGAVLRRSRKPELRTA
jgi:PEP-CTERM motif